MAIGLAGDWGRRPGRLAVVGLAAATLAACATAPPPSRPVSRAGTMSAYAINGVWYHPRAQPNYDAVGLATLYGAGYRGRRTADGEVFDPAAPTAAHTTLPIPCIVEVTNLDNRRRIRVRVNDRGPFAPGRILDLSPAAAAELGLREQGLARVRVRYIGPAPPRGV
jgi:rare lipoprotein A